MEDLVPYQERQAKRTSGCCPPPPSSLRNLYEKREPWPKTGTPKIIDWAERWQSAKETKPEKNDERGGKLKVVWGPKE